MPGHLSRGGVADATAAASGPRQARKKSEIISVFGILHDSDPETCCRTSATRSDHELGAGCIGPDPARRSWSDSYCCGLRSIRPPASARQRTIRARVLRSRAGEIGTLQRGVSAASRPRTILRERARDFFRRHIPGRPRQSRSPRCTSCERLVFLNKDHLWCE